MTRNENIPSLSDTIGPGGKVERRDIVMFTPSVDLPEDELCTQS